MYLGDVTFLHEENDGYNLLHSIVSKFRYNHFLQVKNIKSNNENNHLEYYFERCDKNEDIITACWYDIKLSFMEGKNSSTFRLEVVYGNFNYFVDMYKDLKKIGQSYIENDKDEKFELV